MLSPFDCNSYKDFLREYAQESQERGTLTRMAEAAECQRPYLSKVLQRDSDVHLTPDHMFGICEYLKLTDLEETYLKTLLEKDRASQSKYRKSLEQRLSQLKNQYLDSKKRSGKEQLITDKESSGFYYSYWLYSALHIAVAIPGLQTLAALSKRFGLPEKVLESYLQELEALKLVERKTERNTEKWTWLSGDLHLSHKSLMILPHHMNWRNQAVQNISLRQEDATHYSLVQSLSQKDYERLRLQMVDWIKKFQAVASPSEPEELVCFNLDFFRVGIS